MKALYYDELKGHAGIRLGEFPVPVIDETEVLVRVKAFSLNHLDVWVMERKYPLPVPLPRIFGSDAAGVVERAGRYVNHVAPGDEVVVHPGLSCGRCGRFLAGRRGRAWWALAGGAPRWSPGRARTSDGRLRRGVASDLAYLVRGPGGVRLRVELTLARIDADPGVALSRRREIVTTGQEMSFLEPIDTRKLRPGLYRAELTLFDGQGGVARRWREFEVVEVPKR